MSFRNYYDSSSYGRSRDATRTVASNSTERPTAVTAKYINGSSYKSSSIPILSNERPSSRNKSPISTIASRYNGYNKNEKPISKYDKKDYNKLNVPSISTNRSRDVSPLSNSSKYSISRTPRLTSPERRTKNFKEKTREVSPVDRDKNIPNKSDKSSGYSNISNYKLYPKSSSFNRPSSRAESKPEVTVNRYAIANRLSSNYLRSPPNAKMSSVSPVRYNEGNKPEKSISPVIVNKDDQIQQTPLIEKEIPKESTATENSHCEDETETETISVITRHTSPTPPGSSIYVRTRRADMAKTIEKTITRRKSKPIMVDKEIQSDRLDDPTRTSRFSNNTRMTNWSLYTPSASSYTGYAGRYSTQYSNLRENSGNNYYSERSSRSRSTEPQPPENEQLNNYVNERQDTNSLNNNILTESHGNVTVYNKNNEEDSSEIVINVNLKLKRAKSPSELVSPEITITNSQLPPQAPKQETIVKTKKNKIRKSSTDSSSDSSLNKNFVKKRSKSVSSTDSDQHSEVNDNLNGSSPSNKSSQKLSSSKRKIASPSKIKQFKSRETNSPESSVTLSTQSSISEDETQSKSKTNDVSRTSADETSIPTDRSAKQLLSQRNENGTEDAKSFLIRALAPVTNLFKNKCQDNENSIYSAENSTSESTSKDVSNFLTESEKSSKSKPHTNNIIASNDDNLVQLKAIRHIQSGERAWWMDSDKDSNSNTQDTENLNFTDGKNSKLQCNNLNNIISSNSTESLSLNRQRKKYKFGEDEKPWWLDSSANIPEGVEQLTPPIKSSSESEKSEVFNFFKVRRIESGDQKDWWLTSEDNSTSKSRPDALNYSTKPNSDQPNGAIRRIRHIESGERPWWLSSDNNIPEGVEKLPTPPPATEDSDSSDGDEVQVVYATASRFPPFPLHLSDDEPLGDRRSPEGLETPSETHDYQGHTSPYENERYGKRNLKNYSNYQKSTNKYISRYTDIDDILGTSGRIYSPFMDSILTRKTGISFDDDDKCEEIYPTQVRIHDSTPQRPVIKKLPCRSDIIDYREEDQLDDATLQVFKDGDYGPYLDLDSTLREQDEELEGLQDNRKNAIILRTQLTVRVNAIIERLMECQGRDLRRALFALKRILQSDKDLVHEFVANKGLDTLINVGSKVDHNILQYILRALGQIMLYVDGMHGVMANKICIQWLYTLLSSQYHQVVKTVVKLLVVFVEYNESNCFLLIDAINTVAITDGEQSWEKIMKILLNVDASDTELLIFTTTLINRCLTNIPDKDTYYDQVDVLQDQGIDDVIQLYMSKQGIDLDLLRQLQIFEAVLLYEDGDETGTALQQLDESVIRSVHRRSLTFNKSERRKSKRQLIKDNVKLPEPPLTNTDDKSQNPQRPHFLPSVKDNKENKDLSTALRRRRDRYARQAHHITQQQEMLNNSNVIYHGLFGNNNGTCTNTNGSYSNGFTNTTSYNANGNSTNTKCNGTNGSTHHAKGINGYNSGEDSLNVNNISTKNMNLTDVLKHGNRRYSTGLNQSFNNSTLGHNVNSIDCTSAVLMRQKEMDNTTETRDDRDIILTKELSIKDLAQRLTNPVSPSSEEKLLRVAEMAGLVSKAKEELAKSQSKEVTKSPVLEVTHKLIPIPKLTENDLHWEELRQKCLKRKLYLCDLDFSDLNQELDDKLVAPTTNVGCAPPPPPPAMMLPSVAVPPPPFKTTEVIENTQESKNSTIKKNKKTVKLFWREIPEASIPSHIKSKIGGFIWDDLPEVNLDTKILEHLFESRSNDILIKKLMEPKRNLILDAKRSNAINIAMKKLPTPQTIKAAIMKMDATVIGREGIEKLLTMLPTEEETIKIQEAQVTNPNLPLGSAEQFLLTLASVSELPSRLKLWVFKLDFDNLEKEIAEPLMDLKQGLELLRVNKTFKIILTTLRTVGSFLNGTGVKGFRLEYLSKVMEVKDTVHKHPLLYHICEMIICKFPESTDFFSEVGPVIRASKVDFDILKSNLLKMESDCKASWDHMKKVAKHDSTQMFKTKINDFLTDAAERIIMLTFIKNGVMNRFTKFLLYAGVPPAELDKTKPSEFLKIIAEFALEYRTCRERVLQQLEKKANHRERNKTRGKMIIDVGNYSAKNGDSTADSALTELLKTNTDSHSLIQGRRKPKPTTIQKPFINGELSGDDEIIETLVRSATLQPRSDTPNPRRNRGSDKTLNKLFKAQ